MDAPVVLISGGMGGVGKAAAHRFAKEGYRVFFTYRTKPEEAEAFAKELGKDSEAVACDVRDADAVQALIEYLIEKAGRIDVCVHAAVDPIKRASVEAMTPAEFRAQFETALFGGFNLFSSVIPHMKERKSGLIIGLTTIFIEPSAHTGRMSGYIAAKFALRGLLREIAQETSGTGIRVNAIAPDLLKTGLSSDLPERFFEFAAEKDPRGRITTTEEVAEKILFLTSSPGAAITGMSIPVAVGEPTPL